MDKKLIFRLAAISSITIGSFIGGINYERNRCTKLIDQTSNPYLLYASDDLKKVCSLNSNLMRRNFILKCISIDSIQLKSKPALPIFGTVSAATGYVPDTPKTAAPLIDGNRISQIMKYGFPGLDNVRSYSDYVLSYDRRNRVAHWVFEHLTPESVKSNPTVDRAKCDFKPDESIHPYFRSLNSDYKASGFDRGHLAAAGNHKSHQIHCEQTFYLTNMAPQVGSGFNRDSWNRLEMHVRKLTKTYPNLYVCTGPLYLPKKESDGKAYVKYQVIGNNSVAVPTHFYKVIVGETSDGKFELESYVMPNQVIDDKTPLQVFQVIAFVCAFNKFIHWLEINSFLIFFFNIFRFHPSQLNDPQDYYSLIKLLENN